MKLPDTTTRRFEENKPTADSNADIIMTRGTIENQDSLYKLPLGQTSDFKLLNLPSSAGGD